MAGVTRHGVTRRGAFGLPGLLLVPVFHPLR